MKYDIHNPTKAARVIYDGIPKNGKDGPQTAYHIPAGTRREGVELSDEIAKELIERTRADDARDADLRLTPHDAAAPPKATDKPTLGLKKTAA
jgi:hypothetical protein